MDFVDFQSKIGLIGSKIMAQSFKVGELSEGEVRYRHFIIREI